MDNPVSTAYPTSGEMLTTTAVPVRGVCSTPGMTIDVKITTGTTTLGTSQVMAGSPTATWSTSNWTLKSGQSYTATAWKASDPQITSGNIPYSES
jgi:hypothetical protein